MSLDLELSTGQYATFTPSLVSLNGATLCAWIRIESVGTVLQIVNISGPATNTGRLALRIGTDGAVRLDVRRINGDTVSTAVGAVLSAGTVYHVAGVANYTAGTVQCYVNGVASGSVVNPSGWGSASDANASAGGAIGSRADGNASNHFDGLLEDVRFYRRALSAAEILDVYQRGAGGTAAYNIWALSTTGGGTAGTITDAQGNSNATAVGSPVYAGGILPLGIVTETDTALALTSQHIAPPVITTELDEAFAPSLSVVWYSLYAAGRDRKRYSATVRSAARYRIVIRNNKMSYQIGDTPEISVVFTDDTNARVDPAVVTLKLRTPAGAETTLTGVVQDGLGAYSKLLPVLTEAGEYAYRWIGGNLGGVGAGAASDGGFTCTPSRFAAPL